MKKCVIFHIMIFHFLNDGITVASSWRLKNNIKTFFEMLHKKIKYNWINEKELLFLLFRTLFIYFFLMCIF